MPCVDIFLSYFQAFAQHYFLVRDMRTELMSNIIKELKNLVFDAENQMMIYIVITLFIGLISLILIVM